ncbi:MAG: nitrite/sulfite reductase, partial [Notoacmeibacter sp.]
VTASEADRAAIQVHDIGLKLKRNALGELGFEFYVGGGQGRTPMVAKLVSDFVAERDLLSFTTAVMRVYNLYGRRDNKYKARVKILVHELGLEAFKREVEAEWAIIRESELVLPEHDVAAIKAYFTPPKLPDRPEGLLAMADAFQVDPHFKAWVRQNCNEHIHPDYAIVTISLKAIGAIPGDASDVQMDVVANLAEKFGNDEIRVSHEQNLVLPHVAKADLPALYAVLQKHELAESNAGLISDIIACPGLDYCALATARSIPIAQAISNRFADLEHQRNIGELKLKISGCINACGHHHVGHIGILGIEKRGEEHYQVSLGGAADAGTAVGEIVGPGFSAEELPEKIEVIVDTYLANRASKEERFVDYVRRKGLEP